MNDEISSIDYQKSAILNTPVISDLHKKQLLLHCCCAPCASYVVSHLIESYDITLFFYNPNIEPKEEFIRRKLEFEKLSSMYSLQYGKSIKILESSYDNEIFISTVNALQSEPEGGKRCRLCFDLRLSETAKRARAAGFDIFTTTLTVSPHKNAAIINDCGIRLSLDHNIEYLAADFKKQNGYMKSIELSKKLGLYRQNYCGCRYSLPSNREKTTQ